MSIEIHHGDGLLAMDGMADASVDCIVTDPPYWTLDKWRAVGTTTRLGGGAKGDSDPDKWFQTITAEDLWDFVCHTWRVLKPNRHAWVMCDHETLPSLVGFARECSPEPFDYVKSYPVVKLTADGRGIKAGMGYHGRASHEYVVLLEKGSQKTAERI
jgi:site-specific DNA-methyltransferase (adenine-specific)